jgi:very-short-patch-repair endonuclease
VENGTWNCWRKRNQPSYAEQYVMNILEAYGVEYEYEKPMGRYSVDFAFNDKKIALEIDGKQHEDPSRVESDKRKDEFLLQNGWRVYRIKWHGVYNETLAINTENEIKSFIQEYNLMGRGIA